MIRVVAAAILLALTGCRVQALTPTVSPTRPAQAATQPAMPAPMAAQPIAQPQTVPEPRPEVRAPGVGEDPLPVRAMNPTLAPVSASVPANGVEEVRVYLDRLDAAMARDHQAQSQMLAALRSVTCNNNMDGVEQAARLAEESRAYFQRCCDPLAIGCPRVSELHRLYGAYLEVQAGCYLSVGRSGNPGDTSFAHGMERAQQLKAQADAEEQRVRAWLANAR